MPAVTVDDLAVVPRLEGIDTAASAERPVRAVTVAPRGFEGEGFPVRRAFAGVPQSELDPFVHMDQMGEVEYAPGEAKGTPWHPHRGFETVTYMIDGTFRHRDSHGGGGLITNGDTQWMTAGAGILHIEAPPEELVAAGGLFHGIQLWVNLPAAQKWSTPRYQDIGRGKIALVASPDAGTLVRIIAGQVGGRRGPGTTHTPISLVHATLEAGATLQLPWQPRYNALVYVLSGKGTVSSAGWPIEAGELAVLGRGDHLQVAANRHQDGHAPRLDVLVLGGAPIGEPVAWHGPFVMNTEAEIKQAFEDFRHGRMGEIPAEPAAS
ncbi:MAG: pirin family protein [Acidimicrobiales bacterium]